MHIVDTETITIFCITEYTDVTFHVKYTKQMAIVTIYAYHQKHSCYYLHTYKGRKKINIARNIPTDSSSCNSFMCKLLTALTTTTKNATQICLSQTVIPGSNKPE